MSYATSSGVSSGIRPQAKAPRTKKCSTRFLSASEIARNKTHSETWQHYQGLEQANYNDIPEDLKADVHGVFNIAGRIPLSWVKKGSPIEGFATPGFLKFVRQAHKRNKDLFGEDDSSVDSGGLFIDISLVFAAWESLKEMANSKSKESWSEADYVAHVYTIIRQAGVKRSTRRNQRRVCLPQPIVHDGMDNEARRILGAKIVIPDCVVLIPQSLVKNLSDSKDSAFKRLKKHKIITRSGAPSKHTSFPYQATPFMSLPNAAGFEFASSFSEDKKPSHESMEDAYRQNRMSTASAVRHLHSLHVDAPVFGLTWAHTKVKAHVDWWRRSEDGPDQLVVYSATYSQQNEEKEWNLEDPADLLEVYFLLRNIDSFTIGSFRERVNQGVQRLLGAVVDEGKTFEPWRRSTESVKRPSRAQKENHSTSSNSSPASSPKHSKQKSGAPRRKNRSSH
ncbi:hypothetical protein D9758_000436 [Tetrapyrgos nigripes]|uniref:Uncharacterized protein n=1 Tax=Tetrapyrgos nigripes TaxID=182062 RepID=A0A8H5H1J1_9AGAR|nr:hypothetical protein D9758_000436 [Tetrapyrgos nigripes]